jgi:2-hydroxy-6-oxonona-2,4-dienedioate hydrolase
MYKLKEEGKFKYYEAGNGEPLVLLHGLFGALSNFQDIIDHFSKAFTVSIPMLPLYELEAEETSVTSMVEYVSDFIEHKAFENVILLGNSLGGHIALLYILEKPDKVQALTLTGSSGLFEDSLGNTYPRKSDYEYVKEKTEQTFFDPTMATKELVDEVFEIINNREKAIRVLYMAKSALRHNIKEHIGTINIPVLLIWGKNDTITPAFVGEEFHKHFPHSELHILENCGHAPMMERPKEFIALLDNFLSKLKQYT